MVLFTHHSTFPSNILNKYISIILHPSKFFNWKHMSKFVFKLKILLSRGTWNFYTKLSFTFTEVLQNYFTHFQMQFNFS